MKPDRKRHFPEEEGDEEERRSTPGKVRVKGGDGEVPPTEVISRVGVVVTFVGGHQSRVDPNLRTHRGQDYTAAH